MSDSEAPNIHAPLVDHRLHTLMTIRKDLKKQIEGAIQLLREDAQKARERTERAPKVHDQGNG